MTSMFKVLKADVHHILRSLGECDCFRTTGDCSLHRHDEVK